MRVAVVGTQGQVARSLAERGVARGVEVVNVGRPALDLLNINSVEATLTGVAPSIVVNAAAYTAVDQAESDEETAEQINGRAAGRIAEVAQRLGVPVIHLSTDYVFDGTLDRPYRETDPVAPVSAYGRSKLVGEQLVAAAHPDHVILRTAWVYSPFGKNFVKTMLALGATRSEIAVVADQRGCPTSALDIADAVLEIGGRLAAGASASQRGTFHLVGTGEATWADFAQTALDHAVEFGRSPVRVRGITTQEYPTPARRPMNSRLDTGKLSQTFGVKLPDWRESVRACVGRLLNEADKGP
ncbi:MAG TPA: dTDP-4-dehydrorhamnose reductase [Microvirga sp.]|jgi:dTDP-4-dehydrorhamnose reductase|nr:dTDP-4-dehydrorhamnose reductase [Microvirga sp.]